MFINRPAISALLILALVSQAKAGHPFAFFEGTLDDFDDCLKLNNISLEEYEDFQSYDNLENVISEAVELNYKCNIKCQLEREPTKWLNELGTIDVESMNATSEAAEYIRECMDNAPDEPCAYAYKLVICSFKSGHTDFGSDEYNEDISEAGHPFAFFEGTLDDFDDCLKLNNISLEEYEDFLSYDNLENLLSEAVELNYKCNIKCQLEREPTKWLNELGTIDVDSMNATSEAAKYIKECMDNAPDEPCAYAYKLVICSFKSGHTAFGSDEYNEDVSEAGHPFAFLKELMTISTIV
ncbi:general odorant-binding protein 57a-like [Drosophila gunungcola]|uniref:general odorant-binding protein 57a-like n=1 Tax=Drosophila gunungcola TaxID=103775 RepID=UPI0022E678C0|nr:general odorant-binding protein 57a-like [Drosophila gunungcola]